MIEVSDVLAVGLRADGKLWVSGRLVSGTSRRGEGAAILMTKEEAQFVMGKLARYLEHGREVRDAK